VAKEPSPRPSASEIVPTIPLDDNQRAKDASVVDILDGLQYNGPAISQRKALRDLHTAQSEQKEQLTSSLSRVSAMKQALQSRQLALNNATRKAKGVLADIQDHLELMKRSSPSSGSDIAADTSVSQ
jgi:Lon protease-like protein